MALLPVAVILSQPVTTHTTLPSRFAPVACPGCGRHLPLLVPSANAQGCCQDQGSGTGTTIRGHEPQNAHNTHLRLWWTPAGAGIKLQHASKRNLTPGSNKVKRAGWRDSRAACPLPSRRRSLYCSLALLWRCRMVFIGGPFLACASHRLRPWLVLCSDKKQRIML